ncbi:hypothetical protein D3C85_1818440 [compost metagenome]
MVGVTDDKQIVLSLSYSSTNQLEGCIADVLSLVHHHGANTELGFFLAQQLRSLAEGFFRLTQIGCL